jgi:hypothetical protein
MSQWLPNAIRVPGRSAGPMAPGAGAKIVHHTTQGASAAGAIGAYRATGSWPTLTAEWLGTRMRVYQHMPLDQAARALEHPGGPETNRANCTQIEHVGFAEHASEWPPERMAAIASLCRQIEARTGCPARIVPGTKWGHLNPPRLSGEAFFESSGHAAHMHVPENHHWDVGVVRIDATLGGAGDYAHRALKLGDQGPDVLALQQAVRARASACGRPDRMPDADGQYGKQTKADAIFVAYVLGVGRSQKVLARGGLSADVQHLIRHPGDRNAVQEARAVRRRARYCKGAKS